MPPKTKSAYACDECGERFSSNLGVEQHFHAIKTLNREKPLIVLINLPDGCTPGRWEAAQEFATAIQELCRRYPHRKFAYVPFDHSEGSINSLLVIEQ